MIILIGGTSHTGKTFMAQRLLEKYKFPYLSIDHLKMGLYRADMDCGFTPEDSEDLIGERLWPILKGIIMTNIENGQNLIIEGAYLLPKMVKKLKDEYLEKIISFYLGFSEAYIERFFESEIIGNRCVIENRKYENCDTRESFVLANKRQKELCKRYGAKYFEINEDYVKEIDLVCSWVDNAILCHDHTY
jgi:putative acetyltransferase